MNQQDKIYDYSDEENNNNMKNSVSQIDNKCNLNYFSFLKLQIQ